MSVFEMLSFFLLMSTVAVLLNRQLFKLPQTIGILIFSLGISLVLFVLNLFLQEDFMTLPKQIITNADMPYLFLNGALPLLLFAGAMQVNLKHLLNRVVSITALTVPGTLITIFVFATGIYYLLPLFHLQLSYAWCVGAGAILAPTDPVSVVALIKRLGLPAPVQAVVAGESLFNDGVAVAVFAMVLSIVAEQASPHHVFHVAKELSDAFNLFLREAVGGIMVGFFTGFIASATLKKANDAHMTLLITITLAICTFTLASRMDTSGAIAVVVAGLWMGTDYTSTSIPDRVKVSVKHFWEVIEEIINSLLFLTMGAEVLLMLPSRAVLPIVLLAIPLSILARLLGVVLATLPLPIKYDSKHRLWTILTWGGLRGGVSVALALGLPDGPVKNIMAPVCYAVVVFSIIAQGLSMEKITRFLYPNNDEMEAFEGIAGNEKKDENINENTVMETVEENKK